MVSGAFIVSWWCRTDNGSLQSPAPLCAGDSPTLPNKSDPSISVEVESLADSRTRRSSRAICPRLLAIIRTLGFRCLHTVIHCA